MIELSKAEKKKARGKIIRRVLHGTLTRPEHCQLCWDRGIIEAHHADYRKPLDVVWLCRPCHAYVEGRNSQVERGKYVSPQDKQGLEMIYRAMGHVEHDPQATQVLMNVAMSVIAGKDRLLLT